MHQQLKKLGRPRVYFVIGCSLALAQISLAQGNPPAEAIATQLKQMEHELATYKNGQWDGHVAKARGQLRHCANALNGNGGPATQSAAVDSESIDEPPPEEQDSVLRRHSLALSKILAEGDARVRGKCQGYLQLSIEELQAADTFYSSRHGGPISPPRGAAIPTTAQQQFASPSYSEFMSNMPDESLRKNLWTYFFLAEQAAHSTVTSPDRWVPLIRVEYVLQQRVPGSWSPNGVIHMRAGAAPSDYPGAMFHEIFHTAFQKSVFRTSPGDKMWNEAFCNAFRYASEREFLANPSRWVKKTDDASKKTFGQLIANGDSSQKRIYIYPGTLVIKKSGGTLAGFQKLWRQLSLLHEQRGGDVLDQFFGYTPHGATAK